MSEHLAFVRAKTEEEGRALIGLIADHCFPMMRPTGRSWMEVRGVLDEDQLLELERRGYSTELIEPAADYNGRIHALIERGNPFRDGKLPENGELKAGPWTVDAINSFLHTTAQKYPKWATVNSLPNVSFERRTSYFLVLRAGTLQSRRAVLFTGSIHANEMAGADSCVSFIYRLLMAYQTNTDLYLNKRVFTRQQIAHFMETLDIVVFPCVNPDGRVWAQTRDASWRKNRRPIGQAIGVDCNRNFDFLWHEYNGAPFLISNQPASNVYKGPGPYPHTEAETKNVVELIQRYKSLATFMDIHGDTGDILYAWGDDDDQSSNRSMNFQNAKYTADRGYNKSHPQKIYVEKYMEYIDPKDFELTRRFANRMANAANQVGYKQYQAGQSFTGIGGYYPTVASSDDYAYKQSLLAPGRAKTFTYTLEYSPGGLQNMDQTTNEVMAAMFEMCAIASDT